MHQVHVREHFSIVYFPVDAVSDSAFSVNQVKILFFLVSFCDWLVHKPVSDIIEE